MQKKNAVEILPFNTDKDEKDCKKAIFEFYGAVINNGKIVELDKEFQHCMEKKAVAHAKEVKKELEHLNDSTKNNDNSDKFVAINEENRQKAD